MPEYQCIWCLKNTLLVGALEREDIQLAEVACQGNDPEVVQAQSKAVGPEVAVLLGNLAQVRHEGLHPEADSVLGHIPPMFIVPEVLLCRRSTTQAHSWLPFVGK